MSTDTSNSADNAERRQKMVMALGIATIILFSANLLTVLATHFWPGDGLPFLSKQEVVVAEAPASHFEFRVHSDHDRLHHKHRIIVRAPESVSTIHFDELDRDIAAMEAAAERLEREIALELRELEAKQVQVVLGRSLELVEQAASDQMR